MRRTGAQMRLRFSNEFAKEGDAPAASALKTIPSDLTELAAKNKGKFGENRVAETIKGDFDTPSHGSKDMPVWGPNGERWCDAIAYSQSDEVHRVAAAVGVDPP